MVVSNDPVWALEILKITVPVVLGAFIWAAQTLAQRSWQEFEHRREVYVEIIQSIDASTSTADDAAARASLRVVRKAWLVGSDRVIRAANSLSSSISDSESSSAVREERYWMFIDAMRKDLRTRRWLPPKGTTLSRADFPIGGEMVARPLNRKGSLGVVHRLDVPPGGQRDIDGLKLLAKQAGYKAASGRST